MLFVMLRVFQVPETDPRLWSKTLKNYEVRLPYTNTRSQCVVALTAIGATRPTRSPGHHVLWLRPRLIQARPSIPLHRPSTVLLAFLVIFPRQLCPARWCLPGFFCSLTTYPNHLSFLLLALSYSPIWNQNVPQEIPFFIRNQYFVIARKKSKTAAIISRVKI